MFGGIAGRGAGSETNGRFGEIGAGQVGRYHGLDEVSRCYLAGFSVRIPSVLGQVVCAGIVILPRARRDVSICTGSAYGHD